MTTSSNKFLVATDFGTTATREGGSRACARVLDALTEHREVVLDFINAGFLTPSFVDELVGRLAERLGETAFRARVQLVNVDGSIRPLLRQVLVSRLRPSKSLIGGNADRCHA